MALLQVRFAALKTIEDLARKLGDEYMSLVPETIPFLAELMEGKNCLESVNYLILHLDLFPLIFGVDIYD